MPGAKQAEKLNAKQAFDVLVVGGGPAGASAAIYAARKGIRTGVVTERFGGQVLDTMGIENFISVKETEGPKLVAQLEEHVKSYDVDVMNLQRAEALLPADSEGFYTIRLANGARLRSRSVILSTGARWREMNVPGEREYRGRGVAYCPHCDGPLFKGKRVAVIGGGNSGVEAAIDLAGIVSHVTLIEFDARLRADEVLQRKLRSLPNVRVIVSAQTTEVHGADGKVNALSYRDRNGGETHRLELDGVFVQIGLLPNTEWLKGTLASEPARRDRSGCARPDLAAGRVCRRRCDDRALQADRHCDGRRLEGRAQRLRPPDPQFGAGGASRGLNGRGPPGSPARQPCLGRGRERRRPSAPGRRWPSHRLRSR